MDGYTGCDNVNANHLSVLECKALVELYYATNGSGRSNASKRLNHPDPCEWEGVVCDYECQDANVAVNKCDTASSVT